MRFRSRSTGRDESADAKRLAAIERSVRKAIAEAEAERGGLDRRVSDAKNRASMLMGNEAFEYMEREPETEQELTNTEQQLLAAERRMRQLGTHITHLQRILQALVPK